MNCSECITGQDRSCTRCGGRWSETSPPWTLAGFSDQPPRDGETWWNPPFAYLHPNGVLDGIRVEAHPALLWRTRDAFFAHDDVKGPVVIVWSIQVFRIMNAEVLSGVIFAAWHDKQTNCPTWTDAAGCRCEVDP